MQQKITNKDKCAWVDSHWLSLSNRQSGATEWCVSDRRDPNKDEFFYVVYSSVCDIWNGGLDQFYGNLDAHNAKFVPRGLWRMGAYWAALWLYLANLVAFRLSAIPHDNIQRYALFEKNTSWLLPQYLGWWFEKRYLYNINQKYDFYELLYDYWHSNQ